MSVRDGESFLSQAIDSVISQTFPDFELIVIDDGSTDATSRILDGYSDTRIVRLKNEQPLGLTLSLNRGLCCARGKFIARQDADDLSRPERFERQLNFLQATDHVELLGSSYSLIDSSGAVLQTIELPSSEEAIRWHLLFHNPFCHSSVMFSRKALSAAGGAYNTSYAFAQDYELWARILHKAQGANLPEPLVQLRVHDASVSSRYQSQQQQAANSVSAMLLKDILPAVAKDIPQLSALRSCFFKLPTPPNARTIQFCQLYLNALARLLALGALSPKFVRDERRRWFERALFSCRDVGFPFGYFALLNVIFLNPIQAIRYSFSRLSR